MRRAIWLYIHGKGEAVDSPGGVPERVSGYDTFEGALMCTYLSALRICRVGAVGFRGISLAVWATRIACLVVIAGCSASTPEPAQLATSEELSAISYSLYISRASLTSQEFEQYKTLPQGVFVECGTIYRGRPQTSFQGIEAGTQSQQEATKAAAYALLQILNSNESPKFDEPGVGSGFADPGKYVLTIGSGSSRREIKTSLDWVEQKRTAFAGKVHEFTTLVRGMPSTSPCGNAEFYGIARKSVS